MSEQTKIYVVLSTESGQLTTVSGVFSSWCSAIKQAVLIDIHGEFCECEVAQVENGKIYCEDAQEELQQAFETFAETHIHISKHSTVTRIIELSLDVMTYL